MSSIFAPAENSFGHYMLRNCALSISLFLLRLNKSVTSQNWKNDVPTPDSNFSKHAVFCYIFYILLSKEN